MDEHDILREFIHGDLTFLDAIRRLQKIGYDLKEADQIVSEWADDATHMASDYDEQMGGY